MKNVYEIIKPKRILVLAATLVMSGLMLNNAGGPASNSNGSRVGASFSSGTCGNCHSGGSFSPSLSIQLLSGSNPVTSYASNTNYTLRVTINASNTTSGTRYGFQAVSVQSGTNTALNSWGTLPSGVTSATVSGRTHVENSARSSSNVFNIPWTSPNVSTGAITFYVAGNVVNGTGNTSGDSPVTDTFQILPPCSAASLSTSLTHVLCKGDATGAVNLTLTGGTGPFTYSWTGPNNFTASTKDITNLRAGNYKVVVTPFGAGNCKDSTTVTITEPSTALSITATSNSPVCTVNDSLRLSSTPTGGTGLLSFSWTGPQSYSANTQNPTRSQLTALHAGMYIVTVTDANNCIDTAQTPVIFHPLARVDTFSYTQGTGADSNKISFTGVNIVDADSVIWMFGDGNTNNNNNTSPDHTYASSGSYTVTLIVKNSCNSDTVTGPITIVPPASVRGLSLQSAIAVYPNPASNLLFIENRNGIALSSISINDITGKTVLSINSENKKQAIDISKLSSGVYYLRAVSSSGERFTAPINILK